MVMSKNLCTPELTQIFDDVAERCVTPERYGAVALARVFQFESDDTIELEPIIA